MDTNKTLDVHTPGPWHWDSDPEKNDPYNRIRYRVCALGKTVTQVYYSSFEGGPTNAEADARLIAAAPDLLAAIKALDAYWAEDYDPATGGLVEGRLGQGMHHTTLAIWNVVRTAIAKAEGK